VHDNFPGAHFSAAGVDYICVCGKTVQGVQRKWLSREKPSPPSYAYNSYKQARCCPARPDASVFCAHDAHVWPCSAPLHYLSPFQHSVLPCAATAKQLSTWMC
jgi:hypothetical protein